MPDIEEDDPYLVPLSTPKPARRDRPGMRRFQPAETDWSLDKLPDIETEYRAATGRPLPVSVRGQGRIHNKWGYRHEQSADVGLNPTTKEGQAFAGILERRGIPHLAFDRAIPGVATGPHFHVGRPSRKGTAKPVAQDPYLVPVQPKEEPDDPYLVPLETQAAQSAPQSRRVPRQPVQQPTRQRPAQPKSRFEGVTGGVRGIDTSANRQAPDINQILTQARTEAPRTFAEDRAQRTARVDRERQARSELRWRVKDAGVNEGEYKNFLAQNRVTADSPAMREAFVDFKVKQRMAADPKYRQIEKASGYGDVLSEPGLADLGQRAIETEDAEAQRQARVSQMGVGEKLAQVPKSVVTGFAGGVGTSLKGIAALAKKIDFGKYSYGDAPTTELATYRLGEYITKQSGELVGSNPDLEQEFFAGKAPSTIGQVAQFMMGGWATKSPKLAVAILGSTMTAGDAYDEVRARGGSDDEAVNAGLLAGAILGPTELIGMRGAMKALKGTAREATMKAAMKTALREGRRDVIENALQEVGQEFGQGIITKNPRTGAQLLEAGALGGIGGTATVPLTIATNAPTRGERRERQAEAPQEPRVRQTEREVPAAVEQAERNQIRRELGYPAEVPAPSPSQRAKFLEQKLEDMGAGEATFAGTEHVRQAAISDTRKALAQAQAEAVNEAKNPLASPVVETKPSPELKAAPSPQDTAVLRSLQMRGTAEKGDVSVQIVEHGDGFGVRTTVNGDRREPIEAPMSIKDAQQHAIEQINNPRESQIPVAETAPLSESVQPRQSGGLTMEQARAHLEDAYRNRTLGIGLDRIEQMQGGRLRGKPSTSGVSQNPEVGTSVRSEPKSPKEVIEAAGFEYKEYPQGGYSLAIPVVNRGENTVTHKILKGEVTPETVAAKVAATEAEYDAANKAWEVSQTPQEVSPSVREGETVPTAFQQEQARQNALIDEVWKMSKTQARAEVLALSAESRTIGASDGHIASQEKLLAKGGMPVDFTEAITKSVAKMKARLAEIDERTQILAMRVKPDAPEKPTAQVTHPSPQVEVANAESPTGKGVVQPSESTTKGEPQDAQTAEVTGAKESNQLKSSTEGAAGNAAPSGIVRVPVSELNLDPERFQFKGGHNQKGGTGSLAGVTKWDENLAGVVAAWRDPADGKTYVVNGHNRLETAQGLGVPSVDTKYIEAADAQEARAVGAKINIAEGQGTALDAATFFRDSGATEATLKAQGIPLTKSVARDGLALSKLDDFIFQAVKRGELAEEHGVAIGSKIDNPDLQAQAYKAIAKATEKGRPLTKGVVDEMLDAIGAAPRQTQTEQSLFGDFETEKSLFSERAQVAAAIKRQLAGDKTLFGTAARRSGRLAEGGTTVDVEQARQLQESAAEALGVFDTLKNSTGDISDILNAGAKRVAAGYRPDAVARETYGKIKQAVSEAIRGSGSTIKSRSVGVSEPSKDRPRQPTLGEEASSRWQGQEGFLNIGSARYRRADTPILKEVERVTQGSLKPSRPSPRSLLTRAQTAFTSQFTPLRVLEKTLYGKTKVPGIDLARKFEQVAGAPGKAEADVIEFKQRVVDPIRQHADDFNSYLFLKRVVDRLSKEPERKQVADWTTEKAEQGLEELRLKVGKDVMTKLEQQGDVYQSEMRRALKLQVESGRMTEDLYQKIIDSNDFYAPFKMLKYIEQSEGMPGSGRHIATTQDLTKAITGIHSEDFQLGNFLQVSAEQIVRSRILAEKNLKMLELDRLADLDPTGELIARVKPESHPKPHYERVRYFKDGKESLLEVQKPVADAVQGLNEVQTGLVTKALMVARRPLQIGATSANAAFQVVNSFADTARSALISRYGVRSPLDVVRFPMDWTYAMYSSLKGNFGKPNELYMDFLKSGAANSTIQRELTPGSFKPTLELARGPRYLAKSVIDTVPKLSNAIEESAKLLGLRRGLRIENIAKLEGQAQKEAMERMVTEVRNYSGSPDFARRGSEMRQLNLLVMFLNARVQGTASDVSRLAGRTGAKDAAIAWGRMAAVVGLPTTALALINLSDGYRDDYNKIPEWERTSYWMIPRESFFVNEDTEERVRDYWRIPKRNIFQPFANTIEAGMEFARDREPKAMKKWATTFLEQMSPINIEGESPGERLESMVGSLNPAIKVPVEVATGRDTFRHQDIVPQYMQKAVPAEQYRASTPKGFVRAGKALNISPLALEHATRGASAELFTQFSVRQPQPGRSSLGQYPIARRFVRSGQVADDAGRGERVKEAEQKESGEQVARRRNAITALSEWRGLSESEISSKVAEIEKTDKKLAEKLEQLRDERKKGLSFTDKQIAALGIENGARKEFIQSELTRMKTQAERDAFLEDLKRKELLPKNERPSRPTRPSRPRRLTRAEMRANP